MATTAIYTLLPARQRGTDEEGHAFHIAGRTDWSLVVRVGRLDEASITLKLEDSVDRTDDDDWSAILTETITGTGKIEKSVKGGDFEVDRARPWIRATLEDVTDECGVHVIASAPFFDPNDSGSDVNLLSKRLRGFDEKRTDIIEQAEAMVLDLLGRDRFGRLNIDTDRADLNRAIRREIAAQAEHVFARGELVRKGEYDTLAELDRYADGLKRRVRALRASQAKPVWRHR